MKNWVPTTFLRSRYPLAVLAGILLACAFPNIGISGLAWIAPGLLLALALGTSRKRSFALGYVAGMAHYLTSLYWLLHIPVSGFPILGWIALSAFLALFTATWTWLATRLAMSGPEVPRASRTSLLAPLAPIAFLHPSSNPAESRFQIASHLPATWAARTRWALYCGALWVALEMIVARIFGGFPWNLLGASQFELIPLIQIASITGVYGISFLLAWASASILNAIGEIVRHPHSRSTWAREILLPAVAVAGALFYGFHQLRDTPPETQTVNVTLVQPSIPQTMIWNPSEDMERFGTLLRISNEALTNRTDLLIWPEAAIPKLLRYEPEILGPVTNLAERHQVWMIVGSDDAEPKAGSADPKDAEYYNASFLVAPDGRLANRYRKRSLVIFGEYIPLERWLPFMKWFTPVTGSFTPGDKAVPFEMSLPAQPGESESSRRVKTSVLICFEDNFPHLVKEYVDPDTDFLVNITNNGWFGESAAQWQHAANAIFRAVENGLPLIRCSNNGLTCWVDARGRIRRHFTDAGGTVYGPGFMAAEIPLPESFSRTQTFYNRRGDWFGWSCVAIVGLAGIGREMRKRLQSA